MELHVWKSGDQVCCLHDGRVCGELSMSFRLPLDCGAVWSFGADAAAEGWLKRFASALGLAPGGSCAERHVHFEIMPRRPGEFFGPLLHGYSKAMPSRDWRIREFSDQVLFDHPAVEEIICVMALVVERPSHGVRGGSEDAHLPCI